MPRAALIDRRPYLLLSLVLAIAYFFASDGRVPGLWLIAWKGSCVGVLALYAWDRGRGVDGALIALVMALGAAGDIGIELSLELGAGLGLVGLALARRPGFQVTLTDGDARVCANLRYNAALNDLDEDVVKQFRWEDGLWEEPFDVVLAADCVYDPSLAPPFAAVVALPYSTKVFNSGVFVFEPSLPTAAALAELSARATFGRATGGRVRIRGAGERFALSDQSVLNHHFRSGWHSLPYGYNVGVKTRAVNRKLWARIELAVVHFVHRPKPWEASLADEAAERSDCPSSTNGGRLKPFQRGDLERAFEAAAFRLAVGELSPVVETAAGFHVIRRIS